MLASLKDRILGRKKSLEEVMKEPIVELEGLRCSSCGRYLPKDEKKRELHTCTFRITAGWNKGMKKDRKTGRYYRPEPLTYQDLGLLHCALLQLQIEAEIEKRKQLWRELRHMLDMPFHGFIDAINKNGNKDLMINEYLNQMMLATQNILNSKNQATAMTFYNKLYGQGEYYKMLRILAACMRDDCKDVVIPLLQNLEFIGSMALKSGISFKSKFYESPLLPSL